ncbi:unnamed protein product [Diamesa serratosioi]
MQVNVWCILLATLLVAVESKVIINNNNNNNNNNKEVVVEEPRLFFGQIVGFMTTMGWLPIELNVPDMIGTMVGGMMTMYDMMSSYFGGEGGDEAAPAAMDTIQDQEIIYDEVNFNSRPDLNTRKKKKNNKSKRKTKVHNV